MYSAIHIPSRGIPVAPLIWLPRSMKDRGVEIKLPSSAGFQRRPDRHSTARQCGKRQCQPRLLRGLIEPSSIQMSYDNWAHSGKKALAVGMQTGFRNAVCGRGQGALGGLGIAAGGRKLL